MVTASLINISKSEGDSADTLVGKIHTLKPRKLQNVKKPKKIEALCRQVSDAIRDLTLVQVDEDEIRNRKPKRDRDTPIHYDEDTRWKAEGDIWNNWDSTLWLQNPPHGSVYYNENRELLGVIYQQRSEEGTGKYILYIRKEIADKPHGSLVLIRAMKEKIAEASKLNEGISPKKKKKKTTT